MLEVRAEFYRPDDAERVVAVVRWDGRRAVVEAEGELGEALARVFRLTPVVVEDASLRTLGASGEAMVQPGSVDWFRLAAVTRAPEAGLRARLVPEVREGGWDPAAAYRSFTEVVQQLVTPGSPPGPASP